MRAIKTALKGFHLRKRLNREQIREFINLLGERGLKVSYLLATKYINVAISRIAQRSTHGINIFIYDTPSANEEELVDAIKERLIERGINIFGEIRGKNYFVVLSDVAAYLAALGDYLSKHPSDSREGRGMEEMKEELIKLLKPYNLELLL